MEHVPTSYLARAENWLFITTLAYFLLNGAQIFETAVIVPKWTAAPPVSFQLLKGIDLKTFWVIAHSLHEITFIVALIFCWQINPVRNWLLVLLGIHFAVRVWTLAYFAPNIIEFQRIATGTAAQPDLFSKASLWRTLNYVRVGIFVVVSFGLIPLCTTIMKLRMR